MSNPKLHWIYAHTSLQILWCNFNLKGKTALRDCITPSDLQVCVACWQLSHTASQQCVCVDDQGNERCMHKITALQIWWHTSITKQIVHIGLWTEFWCARTIGFCWNCCSFPNPPNHRLSSLNFALDKMTDPMQSLTPIPSSVAAWVLYQTTANVVASDALPRRTRYLFGCNRASAKGNISRSRSSEVLHTVDRPLITHLRWCTTSVYVTGSKA